MKRIERLFPACKHPIWGGEKLTAVYGKGDGKEKLGETWELSFHPDGLTTLSDGRTLKEAVTPADLGGNAAAFSSFPMLVKLIDASDDLSVQVHPTDAYAAEKENDQGKTEMWIVVDAEPGACLYLGFRRNVSKNEVRAAVKDKTIPSLLNRYEVKPGEVYRVPAGTAHAIGRGCLILEIQENSNLTYRLYDYGRKGPDGRERELHIEKALAVLRRGRFTLSKETVRTADGELLGASRYFTVLRRTVKGKDRLFVDGAGFQCAICVSGHGTLGGQTVDPGNAFFLPAGYGEVTVTGDLTLITASVRRYTLVLSEEEFCLTDDLGRVIRRGTAEKRPPSRTAAALDAFLLPLSMSKSDLFCVKIDPGCYSEAFRAGLEKKLTVPVLFAGSDKI